MKIIQPELSHHFPNWNNIRFSLAGVTANCLHPGMVDSGIWRNVPFPLNLPLWLIVKTCFKVNPPQCNWITLIRYCFLYKIGVSLQTAREGAQTTIYCAVSQALTCANGKYFSECQVRLQRKYFSKLGRKIVAYHVIFQNVFVDRM